MSKKEAVSMRVLKINTCPSLSGRSQLTYHIGCDAEGDIHLRVVQNSGSGQFNADWVPLSMVDRLLSKHPADKPLTSSVLSSVFRGKSSNSPAFLFAALKAESLVLPDYNVGDVDAFRLAMSALIAGDTHVSPEVPKRKRKES